MQVLSSNQSFVTLTEVSSTEILRHFTSVYLALVSLVGVGLNSKALWKLAEVIKVRKFNAAEAQYCPRIELLEKPSYPLYL